jgi:hypothetical protein
VSTSGCHASRGICKGARQKNFCYEGLLKLLGKKLGTPDEKQGGCSYSDLRNIDGGMYAQCRGTKV